MEADCMRKREILRTVLAGVLAVLLLAGCRTLPGMTGPEDRMGPAAVHSCPGR